MTRKQCFEAVKKNGGKIIEVEEIDNYRYAHEALGFRALIERADGKAKWISNCQGNLKGERWRNNKEFYARASAFLEGSKNNSNNSFMVKYNGVEYHFSE